MDSPNNVDMTAIRAKVVEYAEGGEIDKTADMENDKVFIWHGTIDPTVAPGKSKYRLGRKNEKPCA